MHDPRGTRARELQIARGVNVREWMLTDKAFDSHSGRLVLLACVPCSKDDAVRSAFAGIE